MIFFTISGDIPCKKNTIRVSHGHFYHADNCVKEYEALFALQCPKKYKKNLEGKLAVTLIIWKKDNRKDGTNMASTVYDAMQKCGVIKNDRNIVERHEFDYIDKDNPRVDIKLEEV